MDSAAAAAAAAGALLTQVRDVGLGKLIEYLWDKLKSSSPSSSGEVKILLEDALQALKAANQNVKLMQTRNTRFLLEYKQNKSVVSLHKQLEDVNYEIKDLESDFEDIKLQRRMEEINKAAEADITSQSSNGSKRLLPFYRQTVESREKRRQLSTSFQSLNLLTDDDIVRKITSIAKQISLITSMMTDEIKLVECYAIGCPREHYFTQNMCGTTSSLPNERILYGTQNMCGTTSSFPNEEILFGRNYEFKHLIELLLKEPNVSGNVSVIPIVGMGGIGKTTLAQFVFNCTTIKNHFDKKAWICVSDCFNGDRIIKEILASVSIGDGSSQTVPFGITTGLDLLEREIKIKRQLIGKKFLLVLDDVRSQDWQQLLDLFQFAHAEAIKVIVTCRDPKTLGVLGYGGNQISLKGLSDEDSSLIFVKYAFADNNSYPQQLHEIGKQIVGKLKGSPLATKIVGRLLSSRLTEKHWKDVLESDLWKLKTYADDIMSVLALCYYHLPLHLQMCFAFCSVFPKDYEYDMYDLISMWIAQGYIQESEGSPNTLEEIGEQYWHELEARGFFEKGLYGGLKMHDLLHDLAQSNNLRLVVLYAAGYMCATLYRTFKNIQALIIIDSSIQEFPYAIGYLKQLRYLYLEMQADTIFLCSS